MSSYWRGFRSGIPFVFVLLPFGMLFGVLATEAGLRLHETMAFSVVVLAGAAQFTALQLMNDHAPTLVVIASALAVNLRMAMYSAALTPHLGGLPLWKRIVTAYTLVDQSYATSSIDYETHPHDTPTQKFGFLMGAVTPLLPVWGIATFAGAYLGAQIPSGLGLDFALPIAFLAMLGPTLRTPAHRIAALVSALLALLFAFLPYNLGLMVAALGGMMAGARAELWATRKNEARA